MMKKNSNGAGINVTKPLQHKLSSLSLMVLLALFSFSYQALAGACNPTSGICSGDEVWDLSVSGAPGQTTTFKDDSVFNANASTLLIHKLIFTDRSILNATVPIIGPIANFKFISNSVMNALVGNAINEGWQYFSDAAVLNASASNAITGGTQYIHNNAVLNALVSDAVAGGIQQFTNAAILNALASKAITGGAQIFLDNTVLNASISDAISDGVQSFLNDGILNASASNAIAGGTQTFWENAQLNALHREAIIGGTQNFIEAAILNASVGGAISGGTQIFNNYSQLKIGVDDAVAGSLVELNDNSQLLMQGHTAWVSSLAGNGGQVLGQGSTDSTLTINGTHGEDTTFAGVLLNNGGTLNLVKDGTSRQTLTGVGSTVQNIDVLGGTLAFAQDGTFTTTGNYTTHTGATTAIGVDNATLTVGGTFTQQAGSTLDITVGGALDITADTAVLGGQLVINGFADGPAPVKASVATTTTYNLIHTAHGISGNFDNNPLAPTGLDYLLHDGHLSNNDHDYDMRFGLAWTDGLQRQGTGSFTVNAGTAFDIDTALADQIVPTGGFASGWDGRSLTKAGDGLLVLS
ncbi:TPA: hypothetical protein PXM28_004059, partial [Yersinia enterocolitica]|nr:hypothetical protein [Yersinia enterocolitica]